MDKKTGAEHKKKKVMKDRLGVWILVVFSMMMLVTALFAVGIGETGYDRYLKANPTPTPAPSFVRVVTPLPAPTPDYSEISGVSPTPVKYVKTAIIIDGKQAAVLASRQAAEDAIENAVLYFESACGVGVDSVLDNEIEYLSLSDDAECTSFDETFAYLTGNETPLKVLSKRTEYEMLTIKHGTSIVHSNELFAGTRVVKSYGSDGKNRRSSEYTYENGVLKGMRLIDEEVIYAAVMRIVIVGTLPIPEDVTSADFMLSDCPDIDVNFRLPVRGEVVKYFGFYGGEFHHGIDFSSTSGTSCKAASAGEVIAVIERGAYGLVVEIEHYDGLITRYAGLKQAAVAVGDFVSISDPVGFIGEEPMHFEVIVDGRQRNPLAYLDFNN